MDSKIIVLAHESNKTRIETMCSKEDLRATEES